MANAQYPKMIFFDVYDPLFSVTGKLMIQSMCWSGMTTDGHIIQIEDSNGNIVFQGKSLAYKPVIVCFDEPLEVNGLKNGVPYNSGTLNIWLA